MLERASNRKLVISLLYKDPLFQGFSQGCEMSLFLANQPVGCSNRIFQKMENKLMTHLISASQPLHRKRLALHTAVLADTTIYRGVESERGGVDM